MLLPLTHRIIFVSAAEKEMFNESVSRIPSGRAVVVYNGLWESEFEYFGSLSEKDIDVLFLGELRHIKGVDVLLRALAHLSDKGVQLRAVIAGPGDPRSREYFVDMAHSLGLREVAFPGWVEAEETLRRSRLLVLPSRGEALPYGVLEAVAHGVPTVASRVGGIPEVILDNEDLVDPDDWLGLANAIEHATTHYGEALHRAAKRRERAKELFRAQDCVAATRRIYSECAYE